MNDRPHPGPLPQERENRPPASGESSRCDGSIRFHTKTRAAEIAIEPDEFSSLDQPLSLSPGERAGVRANVISSPSQLCLLLTLCLPPSFSSADDARTASGTNALRAHQFITTNTPPQSPAKFNPDSGVPPTRYDATSPAPPGFASKWKTNAPPPPDAPTVFNPDPGASLKSPPASQPFFKNSIAPPPASQSETVPDQLALPRPGVRRDELEFTNPPPATYGREPLPQGLELPRENTRGNRFIKEKWENPEYPYNWGDYKFPPNSEPMTNRWRIGFAPWRRYTSGSVEQPYETPHPLLWHPYKQSILKGDAPILGQDIFLNLTASSETTFELRRVPTPSAVSSSDPNSSEFFGRSEQMFVQNNFCLTAELFRGETVFMPVHWAVTVQPVFNVNYTDTRENNVINPNPQRGTDRTDGFVALQQMSVEVHLRDLSENYDFVAAKIGNQVFNSDFRGFIFNDINLGARVFGNYDNNRWQYNIIAFDMREKDSNSDLNTFNNRDQYVFIANLYRQDFLWHGYIAQLSFHANLDRGRTHYDANGNLARPAPLGTVEDHDVNAYYFGWAGDGHIGRLNLSHAFYQVVGHDSLNGLAGRPVDINAQMAALELSYDRDWVRYKASVFYASGDGNATNGSANGFDTIVDNPNFTGGPFSWYVHQGFNLAGTAVALKQRNSLVPNLRTSKVEGQANFVNPGVFIVGLGAEIEVTPKLRTFINANYIRFMETDPIKTALLTDKVDHELGLDLSIGCQYRPLLTDNIIISAGFGVLIPGAGFRDIYKTSTDPLPGYNTAPPGRVDDFLYSAILAVTLTY